MAKLAGHMGTRETQHSTSHQQTVPQAANIFKLIHVLGIDTTTTDGLARTLPFSPSDTTAGAENEYQTAVTESSRHVDLAREIEESGFFRNLKKRAMRGDTPRFQIAALENFLENNPDQVWENSWVRLPIDKLSLYAQSVLREDLRADKCRPDSPPREDACRFSITLDGQEYLRIPVSYLLKLALADAADGTSTHAAVRETGRSVMGHFLSDNTSPETFSFHPLPMSPSFGMGRSLARETALRFLLSQLLIQYANRQFGLTESGQQAELYFAPHPPVRQKRLNNIDFMEFHPERVLGFLPHELDFTHLRMLWRRWKKRPVYKSWGAA